MTNIAINIIKQKIKYSILILYFFVVSCATGSQLVSDNRIYLGMSKNNYKNYFMAQRFLALMKILFIRII